MPGEAMTILKTLTYNMHKGFGVGNFTLHQMREALEAVDVDVVFLQEIQGEHSGKKQKVADWPNEPQFEFLANRVWPHYAYGKNAIYKAGHHGNAILSKYPFVEWENINVSASRLASRSLLHGVIELPDGKHCHVVCIHLGLFELERKKQFDILSQRIDSHIPHDAMLVIAGDFNDWRRNAEKHFKLELEVSEIFKTMHGRHAKTFPAHWPLLTVDRIYYRGIQPQKCERLSGMPWKKLSDHLPLYAEFIV